MIYTMCHTHLRSATPPVNSPVIGKEIPSVTVSEMASPSSSHLHLSGPYPFSKYFTFGSVGNVNKRAEKDDLLYPKRSPPFRIHCLVYFICYIFFLPRSILNLNPNKTFLFLNEGSKVNKTLVSYIC